MYRITANGGIQRIDTGTIVPNDPLNADYQQFQTWEAAGNTAEPYTYDLSAVQEDMWQKIKAYRDQLSDTGGYAVEVSGETKWFHSDPKSKTQQVALVIVGASLPPIPWKTMDGSFVTMTPALALSVFTAAMTQDTSIFATAEWHKAQMQSVTEPWNYNYKVGWPAVYGIG